MIDKIAICESCKSWRSRFSRDILRLSYILHISFLFVFHNESNMFTFCIYELVFVNGIERLSVIIFNDFLLCLIFKRNQHNCYWLSHIFIFLKSFVAWNYYILKEISQPPASIFQHLHFLPICIFTNPFKIFFLKFQIDYKRCGQKMSQKYFFKELWFLKRKYTHACISIWVLSYSSFYH